MTAHSSPANADPFAIENVLRFHAQETRVFDTENDAVLVTRTLLNAAASEIEGLRLEHQYACQEIGVAIEERDAARSLIRAQPAASPENETPRGYTEAEGCAASLRQQADLMEKANAGAVSAYVAIDDFDVDELREAADFIEHISAQRTRHTSDSVSEYLADYEFRFDGGGGYVPTDSERAMLEDAIEGYMSCLEGMGVPAKAAEGSRPDLPEGGKPSPTPQYVPDREQIAKLIEFNCHRIAMIKLYEPRMIECRKLTDAVLAFTSPGCKS